MTARCTHLVIASIIAVALTSSAAFADTYANSKYGFSFKCPDGYNVDAESDYYFDIRDAEGKLILTGNIEDAKLYPRDLYEDRPDPFKGFGTWRALLRCDADGPDGSAYCPSLKKAKESRTRNGLRTLELMLMHVQETYGDSPAKEESVTGPLYVVDLTRDGRTVALMLGTRPYELMTMEQRNIATSILDTIKFTD